MATLNYQKGYTKVWGLFIFGFENDTILAFSDSFENFIFIHVNKNNFIQMKLQVENIVFPFPLLRFFYLNAIILSSDSLISLS